MNFARGKIPLRGKAAGNVYIVYQPRELIRDTPVHKGQRDVTTATSFGTRIATNAFLRDTTGM